MANINRIFDIGLLAIVGALGATVAWQISEADSAPVRKDSDTYQLVHNVTYPDGSVHDFIIDSGMSKADCLDAMWDMRRTACEVEGR
jgi:hypothetical protein